MFSCRATHMSRSKLQTRSWRKRHHKISHIVCHLVIKPMHIEIYWTSPLFHFWLSKSLPDGLAIRAIKARPKPWGFWFHQTIVFVHSFYQIDVEKLFFRESFLDRFSSKEYKLDATHQYRFDIDVPRMMDSREIAVQYWTQKNWGHFYPFTKIHV